MAVYLRARIAGIRQMMVSAGSLIVCMYLPPIDLSPHHFPARPQLSMPHAHRGVAARRQGRGQSEHCRGLHLPPLSDEVYERQV